jgi:ABC-type microcin C transport system permease subunit YejE
MVEKELNNQSQEHPTSNTEEILDGDDPETNVPTNPTYKHLLIHTKKGRAVLAMGILHTTTVSGCLTAAYFIAGIETTIGLTVLYTIAVTINTYVNNKKNRSMLWLTILFIVIIPMIISLLIITGYMLIT